MLRGIFTSQIGTQDITQKALEAEARGDFAQALQLYNKVCTRSSIPAFKDHLITGFEKINLFSLEYAKHGNYCWELQTD